jgi:shikimate dehydrogenase
MHVPAPGFPAFLAGVRAVRNFAGAVISMPHKVVAAGLVDELTPAARLAGAVNVIRRADDGRLTGTLLDGEGFVAGLRAAGHEVAGARIGLAGAGGAAAAIAFALVGHGCAALTIVNRSAARAADLVDRIRGALPGAPVAAGTVPAGSLDVLINATPLGMPADDPLPFDAEVVGRAELVAECVIAPERTALLDLAARLGKRIHTGVPMLEAQIDLMLEFMGALDARR